MSPRRGDEHRERDRHVHSAVAMAVAALALLAVGLAWQRWMSDAGSLAAPTLAFTLCLVLVTVATYRVPLQVSPHTKVYLSSVGYYLLAVLVTPPLAATAAGLGCAIGELSERRSRGTEVTDIVAQVGRRVVVVLLGSIVAHLTEHGVAHTLLLVAAALILGIGDIVTFPIIVARLTDQPPWRVIVTTTRHAYLVEGAQYLLGVLGGLAWAREYWALALLAPPTALVYLAFRANAQASEARRAAQEAADALRESEMRYRTLFENAGDIVYTYDLAGNFTSVNQASERVLGYKPEDLVQRSITDIVAPDHVERAGNILQTTLQQTGTVTGEFDVLSKNGRRVTLEARSRPTFRGGQIVGIQGIARDVTERRRVEEERAEHARELAVRVLQAQEEERKRIARELHDETAQSLSVLLAHLDLLEGYIPEDGTQLRAGLERIGSLAKRALDETRALSHDLRPTILDDVGLTAALEWLSREYERTYGGAVAVSVDPKAGELLGTEEEVALFRIAQEALTNSGKHAAARAVRVSLSLPDSVARLVVEDDGRGFDLQRAPRPSREGHLGLYGMRERASLLGGRIEITSQSGGGTRVEAEIPVTGDRASHTAHRELALVETEVETVPRAWNGRLRPRTRVAPSYPSSNRG